MGEKYSDIFVGQRIHYCPYAPRNKVFLMPKWYFKSWESANVVSCPVCGWFRWEAP